MSQACAVHFVAKERAELVAEAHRDQPLGPHEISGQTLVSLISPGTELSWGYTGDKFPIGSGYAALFQVEAMGSEVTDVKVGDRGICLGNHRSDQRVERDRMVLVPEGLDPMQAVFARLMVVSMATLTTTTARPPGRVLVTGLGAVGHIAAQNFAGAGYEVWACDPDAGRREMALRAGIQTVVAKVPVEDQAWAGKIDLVVECSGHEGAVLDGCKVVRTGGEVVLLGVPWKRKSEVYAFDVLHAVFHRYAVLRSGWEWELPWNETDYRIGSTVGNITGAIRWLAEGRVKVAGIYVVLSPRECQRAYQELLTQKPGKLTTVLDWRLLK